MNVYQNNVDMDDQFIEDYERKIKDYEETDNSKLSSQVK